MSRSDYIKSSDRKFGKPDAFAKIGSFSGLEKQFNSDASSFTISDSEKSAASHPYGQRYDKDLYKQYEKFGQELENKYCDKSGKDSYVIKKGKNYNIQIYQCHKKHCNKVNCQDWMSCHAKHCRSCL